MTPADEEVRVRLGRFAMRRRQRHPNAEPTVGAVLLVTASPDVPSRADSLEQLLGSAPLREWAGRLGIERMWTLGSWLRRLHATPPDLAPAVTARTAEQRLIPDLAHAGGLDGVDELATAHAASLQNWSTRLLDDPCLGHGRFGLDHVFADVGETVDRVVVEAVGGLAMVHPAVDVGAVTGGMIELTHRARIRGDDASAFERLLSAFLTGYRGFASGGNLEDLGIYRAAALQIALHSQTHAEPVDRALGGQLARTLVEHCWAIGADPTDTSPPRGGDIAPS